MTSPAATPTVSADDLTPAETAAAAALATFLASPSAVPAAALPAALVTQLSALGLSVRAVRAAGRMVLHPALTGRTRWGSPARRGGPQSMTRRMAAAEPEYRARYLLAAAQRLTEAGRKRRFTQGLRRESAYLAAHRRAGKRRARIARDYDQVARRSEILMWTSVLDERTTPDCRARHGTRWHRDNPPFPPPGAQHIACRCRARPAFGPS